MSKGIALSVFASVLFAVMYFYTSLLAPLDGEEIFGWRMLLTMPCMTLFMLVSAFAGLDTMRAAYGHAIANEYRFYSYGDASLLFRAPQPEEDAL